jgi:predicted nucleic acid-binding protein
VILADTSIWIDHIRSPNPALVSALTNGRVRMHPYIVGELALGNLRQRGQFLEDLYRIRQPKVASFDEVMLLIEQGALYGTGLGWVDANILATVLATPGLKLLTRDRRLGSVAERLNVAAESMH